MRAAFYIVVFSAFPPDQPWWSWLIFLLAVLESLSVEAGR
jgi:hypothetical protein